MDFLFGYSGRIGRSLWWLGTLVPLALLTLIFILIAIDVGPIPPGTSGERLMSLVSGSTFAAVLAIMLISAWINIALTVKRFHDRNKSGVWALIMFVPYVGSLWILIECGFLGGTDGPNDYDVDLPASARRPSIDRVMQASQMPSSASIRAEGHGRAEAQPVYARRPRGFGKRGST